MKYFILLMTLVLSSCSNNCWCQGDVSDAFKELMPDNATWATKEEFDKAPVVGYIVEGIGLVFTDREGHEVNA